MDPVTKKNKKIRKGDKVVAIAGDCRGQTGNVLSLVGDKAIVQGLNVKKKHMKGSQNQPGKIIELEKPIHLSNLKVCSEDGKAVKLKTRIDHNGERQLVYKEDGREILYRSVKKS